MRRFYEPITFDYIVELPRNRAAARTDPATEQRRFPCAYDT
jgi:hypothetical protein